MNVDLMIEIKLRRAAKRFTQDLLFDFELMFIAGVLVVAAAALAEIGAGGRNAMRGRLDDRISFGAREAGLMFGEGSFDFFSGKNERDEDGFAARMVVRARIRRARIGRATIGRVVVGGQASQAVAAVDEFFDGEEQVQILNDAVTRRGRRLHLRPTPTGN